MCHAPIRLPLSVPLDGVTHSADPYVETTEWRNEGMHYKNGIAERVDIEDGYLQLDVNKTSGALNAIGYYAYICDHLGSIRQVCDAVTGDVVQSLEYYPSGLIFRSTNYDRQTNKYVGKELISMHGLNQYDSDTRMQEFQIPHFTTRDLMCEKYYDWSPYAYCMGNPIKYIDMDGRESSVSDWLSIQNFNMDIYNKQVFSSASSVHVPQFVLEHLFIDSYKIEDNPQKSEKTEKKKSATALPIPILTTLGTAAEAFGTTVVSYIGPIFIILTLQGDSSPKRTVDEATDSSKNEKHGDDGRAKAKSEKQIKDLEQQKELAKNKKERQALEKTIRNIRQTGELKNKGEEHGRNSKR